MNILSTFGDALAKADAKAFAALMRHIREVDGANHTVLMMQVENEVGIVGDSRDRGPTANAAYDQPTALIKYNGIGFSPFGIERERPVGRGGFGGFGGRRPEASATNETSVTSTAPPPDAFAQTYALLQYLSPVILANQGKAGICEPRGEDDLISDFAASHPHFMCHRDI